MALAKKEDYEWLIRANWVCELCTHDVSVACNLSGRWQNIFVRDWMQKKRHVTQLLIHPLLAPRICPEMTPMMTCNHLSLRRFRPPIAEYYLAVKCNLFEVQDINTALDS